jgi:DNA (cytosine-5)-methyltransferase 1
MSVTGSTPQTNVGRNKIRETFTVQDARDAMQTPWMTMAGMSQAIPPAYARWIGERLMEIL